MDSVPPYYNFYRRTLSDLLQRGIITRQMSVLVICGGETDMNALRELGFSKVTITNLDSEMTESETAPYHWAFQDAENLTYPDDSFDFVVVCAGLHHCHSPHRALLESYRVAKHCALALEARDSLFSRIAVYLNVVDEYELTGVVDNDYAFGGVKNTSVPNYVYRWTEREVLKTVASFAPYSQPNILWYHAFAPPISLLKGRKNLMGLMVLYAAFPALWLITKLFKRQGNLFAFAVLKPDFAQELHPWLKLQNGSPTANPKWLEAHFKHSKPGEETIS